MIYEIQRSTERELSFVTHPRARRGRGVLYAIAPFVFYLLAISILFALSIRDLSLWDAVRRTAIAGIAVATVLAMSAFWLGHRVRDRVEADLDSLRVRHTPSVGGEGVVQLWWKEVAALAIDPSLRSLGTDVLLVAVHRDGRRIPLAEGEPHSGQLRGLAVRLSTLGGVSLEAPRFTRPDLGA